MRDSRNSRESLLAAMSIALMGAGFDVAQAVPVRRPAGDNGRGRASSQSQDGALSREIAEHNAALDRRKAEKKARKLAARAEAAIKGVA